MSELDPRRKTSWWTRIVGTDAEVASARAEAEAIFQEQAESIARLQAALDAANQALEARALELAAAQRSYASLTEESARATRAAEATRARLVEEHTRARDATDTEMASLRAQAKNLSAQVDAARQKRVQLEGALAAKTADAESQRATAVSLRDQVTRAARDLEATTAHLTAARADLSKRDAELVKCQSDLSKRDAELAERDAELVKCQSDLSKRDAELVKCQSDLSKRDSDLAERDAELAKRDADLSKRDAELAERAAELARCKEDLAKREVDVRALRMVADTVPSLEEQCESLVSRISGLEIEKGQSKEAVREEEERASRASAAARVLADVGMQAVHVCVGAQMSLPLRIAWAARSPAAGPLPAEAPALLAWLQTHLSAAGLGAAVSWNEAGLTVAPSAGQVDPFTLEWVRALAEAIVPQST